MLHVDPLLHPKPCWQPLAIKRGALGVLDVTQEQSEALEWSRMRGDAERDRVHPSHGMCRAIPAPPAGLDVPKEQLSPGFIHEHSRAKNSRIPGDPSPF